MKNNEAYPQMRFKGFNDAWEQRKFEEFFSKVLSGNRLPKSMIEAGNMPYVIATKDNNGVGAYVSHGQIDFSGNKMKRFPSNSITVSIDNPEAIFLQTKPFVASNVMRVLHNNDLTFNQLTVLLQMLRASTHGFDWSIKFSGPVIQSIEFLSPSTPDELEQIGKFISTIDDIIAFHQRKLDKLKELKQGYLQKLFPKQGEKVPELRFKGFDDAWEERKLKTMGSTFTGLSGKTKDDFGHGNAKFVTYMNVFSNPVSKAKMVESVEVDSKQHQVEYGDVFFTTSSETPQEVGMSSVWLESTANIYLNSFCFGYHPTVKNNSYYLAFMLRSSVVRKKFVYLSQGISRYNISKNKVMEMLVPVPDLVEQKKVGQHFKQLDQIIIFQQRKLEKLIELKKGYLQKMFC